MCLSWCSSAGLAVASARGQRMDFLLTPDRWRHVKLTAAATPTARACLWLHHFTAQGMMEHWCVLSKSTQACLSSCFGLAFLLPPSSSFPATLTETGVFCPTWNLSQKRVGIRLHCPPWKLLSMTEGRWAALLSPFLFFFLSAGSDFLTREKCNNECTQDPYQGRLKHKMDRISLTQADR